MPKFETIVQRATVNNAIARDKTYCVHGAGNEKAGRSITSKLISSVVKRQLIAANWYQEAFSSTLTWGCIAWSANLQLFVAAATNGAANYIATSPDGITWTFSSPSAPAVYVKMIYIEPDAFFASGLFVVVIGSAGGTQAAYTSTDAVTWTLRTTNIVSLGGVCYSSTLGMIAAVSFTGSVSAVTTSTNGTAWTTRTADISCAPRDICWSTRQSKFVAVGQDTIIITSSDGVTWNGKAVAGGQWNRIAFSEELNLFVVISIDNKYATSTDAVTWTVHGTLKTAGSVWTDLLWISELGLFVACSSTNASDSMLIYSFDGITWNIGRIPSMHSWVRIAWSPQYGKMLMIGNDGVTNPLVSSLAVSI